MYDLDKLIKYNHAERYDRLPTRHNILAQNGENVSHMHPEDIVKLVEDTNYSITLSMEPAKRKHIYNLKFLSTTSLRFSVV